MSPSVPGPLTGSRVRLRPLRPGDAADHARWRNDPDVAWWATGSDVTFSPVPESEVARWFNEKLLQLDPHVAGTLAVELLDDGRHVGMVTYRDVDSVARSAVVGVTIGEKDLWGQGYGTQALGLLVGHLFARLNLHRIQLDTWAGNERALRSFARLGFHREGQLRDAVWTPKGYADMIVMGLLRREWDALASSPEGHPS